MSQIFIISSIGRDMVVFGFTRRSFGRFKPLLKVQESTNKNDLINLYSHHNKIKFTIVFYLRTFGICHHKYLHDEEKYILNNI